MHLLDTKNKFVMVADNDPVLLWLLLILVQTLLEIRDVDMPVIPGLAIILLELDFHLDSDFAPMSIQMIEIILNSQVLYFKHLCFNC